jgi:hypothetical protein
VFHCVLGSEGCVLVPRSSGTPVATWAWPIWVVSRRRVLEAVFILLEFPPPSRRIFIGSHSLPPLWFAVSVLQESKGKEPRRVHTYIPHQIPNSKVPKTHQENHQERAPKITTKNNREQHNKALRNHAESSIHTKEVHTRSSLPPDHPTLSQDLTMKLSS